jgi:beta-N-acetylhexosaminidase
MDQRWARGWLPVAIALAACSATPSRAADTPSPPPTSPPTTDISPAASTDAVTSTDPTTTAPTSVAPTTVAPLDPTRARVTACVQGWPVRDRIALTVWPAVYGDRWPQAQAIVRDLRVGGVVLMSPPVATAEGIAAHLDGLEALSAHGLLVATDEEGGDVQRLRALGALASQEALSARPADEVRALLAVHTAAVKASGVDVVFAPVVDVRPPGGGDPLGDGRLFRGDAQQVTAWAQLYVDSWLAVGVTPVLKHFPGHGSASADSHDGLPTTPSLAELRTRDLLPYAQLAGSSAVVMVGHLAVPGLTDGMPASRSAAAVTLLRDELGWGDVLTVSDALGMGGMGLSVPQAAVAALQAGIDVVIFTGNGETEAVIAAIEAAVADGSLPVARIDEAATRVALLLEAHGHPCT